MSISKKLKLNEGNCYDYTAESKYFLPPPNIPQKYFNNIAEHLLKIEIDLATKLKNINFKSPVQCVYNPLEYAYSTHSMFVNKYCSSTKKILFLGLNPGPWGMAQTGVPFGEVKITRDWLQISGHVDKPLNEISARPVLGFECHRSEISGKKFWSLFRDLCGSPEYFFKYSYMHNYCPLLLMRNTGSNVTPADLKNSEAVELLKLCDESLSQIIKLLKVEIVVGIGRFAQKRAESTIKTYSLNSVRVQFLIHPSPRIPKNEDWIIKATQSLTDLDLIQYFKGE